MKTRRCRNECGTTDDLPATPVVDGERLSLRRQLLDSDSETFSETFGVFLWSVVLGAENRLSLPNRDSPI